MNSAPDSAPDIVRLKVVVRGAVQGVGFRPFVFRLAQQLGLNGRVNNSAQGVFIEAEGIKELLEEFLTRLQSEKPPRSFIQSLESSWLDPVNYTDFQIRPSELGGTRSALVMPDIATCAECLSEIFDPKNRRYFYPFTNCTNCGPRFSIIESLPYDRPSTSMKSFAMCAQCQAEYENPHDRRFHAQPNACPVCGPHLELWNDEGKAVATEAGISGASPLKLAAEAIASGQIVAVKGLGGFHLISTASDTSVVQRLRQRKHREEKPFAVMFPSLESVRSVCDVSLLEERSLTSPEAPIVLLRRLAESNLSPAVAPANPNLGVMLPYTPLHQLLLSLLQVPVIATSGNLSDEPICTDEHEALDRLKGIADLFLVHNRPIVRHVDDSVVRVMAGREIILRRARGYAPLPVEVRSADHETLDEANETAVTTSESNSALRSSNSAPPTVLAVGAHLKNSVALAIGPQVFISQHIGDLETAQAYEAFERVATDLQKLYEAPASLLVADQHPDYLSTKFAQQAKAPHRAVQHHVAHILSCMAENELSLPILGVAWDGTGYGLDGTIWGGEFFRIDRNGFERVAHLRQFRLPGGEQAVREPRRCALGMLFEASGQAAFNQVELPPVGAFSSNELAGLKQMLTRQINSPLTSSVGRLFDAVASLIGLRQIARFEGQAAMELEFAIQTASESAAYEMSLNETAAPAILDWRPILNPLLGELKTEISVSTISARFHNTLVEGILKVARRTGLERVVLSGGCFQNRYLTESTVRRLREEGFRPYWHQCVPPNDGGICLGQVIAARWWRV